MLSFHESLYLALHFSSLHRFYFSEIAFPYVSVYVSFGYYIIIISIIIIKKMNHFVFLEEFVGYDTSKYCLSMKIFFFRDLCSVCKCFCFL